MQDPVFPSPVPPWRIGVDVGGTFTDLVLVDDSGRVWPHKSPSEPGNPAVGVLRAVETAAVALGMPVQRLLGECAHLIHGTTVATNVLLERTGARVGLLTTAGFRDTLEIRRGYRENMWDHRTPWKDALVPRSLRLPVAGRVSAAGEVLEPLDEAAVLEAARRFREAGVEAVAICLLNSYANPAHERRCRDLLRQALPGVPVTASADLVPIVGEYERCSTTVANAYVAPKVLPYLRELEARLRTLGLRRNLLLVQSSGGAVSLAQVEPRPAALALSGPAAGVASMRLYGGLLGTPDLMAIEIGGTSCDITVVHDGEVSEADLIRVDETLIALPAIDIHTISAGGGTICGTDPGGLLFAGPHGAGAKPGPACYGLGGTEPTVTDAQLVLGRLRAGSYAGNTLTLDVDLAQAAIGRRVAEPLGLGIVQAAAGMLRLVEQNIRHAMEKVAFERGLDLSKFVLVGAGGAGALHVAAVARAAGCKGAFVPRLAGVFCAFGMCNAQIRHDFIQPVGAALGSGPIAPGLEGLARSARARLAEDGFGEAEIACVAALDLRYYGQQWTIRTVLDQFDEDTAAIRRRFEAAYERQYASVQPGAAIEIVNVRLSGFGRLPPLDLQARIGNAGSPRVRGSRPVYLEPVGDFCTVAVLSGADLLPGHVVEGPAIVEESTTTILVGPADVLTVTAYGDYLISFEGAAP